MTEKLRAASRERWREISAAREASEMSADDMMYEISESEAAEVLHPLHVHPLHMHPPICSTVPDCACGSCDRSLLCVDTQVMAEAMAGMVRRNVTSPVRVHERS